MDNAHCQHAAELMYLYLDRELTWYRRTRLRLHLQRCDPCSGIFAFEGRLWTLVKDKCAEELPPGLLERLRTMIREEPTA